MHTKYQLVTIGNDSPFLQNILDTFFLHIIELGLTRDMVIILDEHNFKDNYKANAPTVCLYFGGSSRYYPNLDILDLLLKDATITLPVVENINQLATLIPTQLHLINGFELKSESEIELLVSRILEGLNLLRLSRRLFISYKRNESRDVAVQLYERLEEAGFDVFLDTHSIRTGDVFQDELWHRLADTDVVVLLDTPGFLGSKWTKEELARANTMSIGIPQLVWPNHTPDKMSDLSIQIQLSASDFKYLQLNSLKSKTIENIVSKTESLRARSLASKQDNLIAEFISEANKQKISASLQPEKIITIDKPNSDEIVIIPTVGVPHAFTYNQSEELVKRIRKHKENKIWLLYDHRNIRDKWLEHLAWLDIYLPIQSVKITGIEQWLKKI
jgi:hypothetical protein